MILAFAKVQRKTITSRSISHNLFLLRDIFFRSIFYRLNCCNYYTKHLFAKINPVEIFNIFRMIQSRLCHRQTIVDLIAL